MSERTTPEWLLNFMTHPTEEVGRDLMTCLRDPESSQLNDLQRAAEDGYLSPEAQRLYDAVHAVHRWKEERFGNDGSPVEDRHIRDLRAHIANATFIGDPSLFDADDFRMDSFASAPHAVAFLTDSMRNPGEAIADVVTRRLPPWMKGLDTGQSLEAETRLGVSERALRGGILPADSKGLDSMTQAMVSGVQAASLAVERQLEQADALGRAQNLWAQAMQGISGLLHGLTERDYVFLKGAMGERHVTYLRSLDAIQLTTAEETYRDERKGQLRLVGVQRPVEGRTLTAPGQQLVPVSDAQFVLMNPELAGTERLVAMTMERHTMQEALSSKFTFKDEQARLVVEERGPIHPVPHYTRVTEVTMPPIVVSSVRGTAFSTGRDGHVHQEYDSNGGLRIDAHAGDNGVSGGVIGADTVSIGQAEIHTTVSFSSGR